MKRKNKLETGRAYSAADLDELREPSAPQGAQVPIWELDWALNRNTLQWVLFDICEDALGRFPGVGPGEGFARRISRANFFALLAWIQNYDINEPVPLAKRDRKEWPHLAPLVAMILIKARMLDDDSEFWLFERELLAPVWRWLSSAPALIDLPPQRDPFGGLLQ